MPYLIVRGIGFEIKDMVALEQMELTLASKRGTNRTKMRYRSELVRYAVRRLSERPDLLDVLAENPA